MFHLRHLLSKVNLQQRLVQNGYIHQKMMFNEKCLDVWGQQIRSNYFGDPENSGVPDPKLKNPTFSSFRDFKNHQISTHYLKADCHEEKRCLLYSGHNSCDWPHGKAEYSMNQVV